MHVHKIFFMKLVGRHRPAGRLGEVLLGVVKGRPAQQGLSHKKESFAVIVGDGCPAGVGACAGLLRTDIVEEEVIHCAAVPACESTCFAVAVVLLRAAAEPLHTTVFLRHAQVHAVARQVGQHRVAGEETVAHQDGAVAEDGIVQLIGGV